MQQDDLDYYTRNKDKMLKLNQVAEKIVDMIFDHKRKYDNSQSTEIG